MAKLLTEDDQRHTQVMQDIIGAPPAWLLQWGITLFFSVLVMILGLSELIRFPDIVDAQLKVISVTPSQLITSVMGGKLVKIFVQNKQEVKIGQELAIIKTPQGNMSLTAPATGKIAYLGIVYLNQEILPGQDIFQISSNNEAFFGEMIIAPVNIEKVKEGQQVIIKLLNKPNAVLHGSIKYITQNAYKDDKFIAEVDFKTQNKPDLDKQVKLKQGMLANAEIITQDATIWQRLTRSIATIIKNK